MSFTVYVFYVILYSIISTPGANAFIEAILGGMFAFSYVYSGNNIAVPIAIHGLYDFGTIFFTWLLASRGKCNKLCC